jgi:hypothetical protein
MAKPKTSAPIAQASYPKQRENYIKMPYTLRLKVYTNESLEEGDVKVPERVENSGPQLLHCHPNDYLKILKIISQYYKEKRNGITKKTCTCGDPNCGCTTEAPSSTSSTETS